MADEIVLSFHDSLLRESDLSLLQEGRWLNDRLIGFVFEMMGRSVFILTAKGSPAFVESRCPQQTNSYDCGVYVICVAEELCKNFLASKETSLSDTVTAENIQQKRRALKKLILDLGQTKT
ncbi:sentrin-specific protease 8-like [Orbicella faveolata]|uniref:sentrin-specific protease 8-like n=1 Tax=Orbicella faveolata TaxID=48498 RepID=UPI0009E4B136|nr:sentrin-specific protease 8-like [Orbicella faveolata]